MTESLLLTGGATLVAAALSARWNWWRLPKTGLPVLMYHKVGTPPAGSKMHGLWVSPEMFRKQMSYLQKNGYTPVIFKDIYNHWDGKTPLPQKPVFITFDDGYANNYLEAFPILREFRFPATLFVVVQTVGWDNKWHDPISESRIPMVTWSQLQELRKAGWEIGSHTMNHPRLPKIEKKEAQVEIEKSRRIIGEFLGEIPDTFAYPYGAGEDDAVLRDMVKAAGYRLAVGIHAGLWPIEHIQSNSYNLPRIFVKGGENMLDFHLQMTRGRSRF